MKKIATTLLAALLVTTCVSAAMAAGPGPFWAKGDYYCAPGCWNADGGNLMTFNGGTGIWTGTVMSDQAAGRHEFKIANADWSESYFPWCNLWVHTSGPGDVVTFTLDTNTYSDGWMPTTNIVWSDHYAPPGTTFEVIGGAPETGNWGSGTPANLIGNVWSRVLTIATPGTYGAKFRATGTWDVCNVGSEGAAAPCGADLQYTTSVSNTDVLFEFNRATGRARVMVLGPTPAKAKSWGQVKTLYR